MTTPYSALLVEDDHAMRASLEALLEAAGWRVTSLPRAMQVSDRLVSALPDVILSDVQMPGMTGLELLKSLDPTLAPPVVLISAHGDIPMAVEAMAAGAYSFVEKPYEPRRLLTILTHAAEQHRMAQENSRLRARLLRLSGLYRVLLGQSPQIRDLRADVLVLADTHIPVLIDGETGTGKELVARALHDLSPRAQAPFVAINCATLTPESFEAQFFGTAEAPGRLFSAAGGTLFLDEICACPVLVQAKMLRVIEDKQVFLPGSGAPVPLDFRLVSATNQDLTTAVAEGRLRQDLLFRLNNGQLSLPALRARLDDIALLFTHFLTEAAQTFEIRPPDLTAEDSAALLAHDWPGNVRELRSVAERRVLSARRGGGSVQAALQTDSSFYDVPVTLREAVASFERELIAKAIRAHEGRMDAAAEALGIGRRTLNEKIVKLALDKDALL